METRIVILGGYGNARAIIARLLARESGLAIVLAGRRLEKARQLAAEINRACGAERVSARQVDASDYHALLEVLKDAACSISMGRSAGQGSGFRHAPSSRYDSSTISRGMACRC